MNSQELWSDFPTDIKKLFLNTAKSLNYKRGQYIYRQGELAQGIYFIESGLIGFIVTGSTSGKEHLLRFFKQGQFFGHRALFSEEEYHGSTQAIEPTVLKHVPKKIILSAFEQQPQLFYKMIKVLSKELRRSENHQVMILENHILVRTAQALIYLKDLHPQHNWTRQEIANFCASTTSTVIKALAQLEDLKLIRQTGRTIEVLNRAELIALQD